MSALPVGVNVAAIPVDALGAGQYTVELVRALGARDDVAVTLVARRDDVARWRVAAPGAHVDGTAPSGRVARLAWEEVGLTATVRMHRDRFGVLHGPHYSLPAASGRPAVVTVHDLTFVDHPEWHEPAKVAYFRRALRLAARRADVVVCVSGRTAERYVDLYRPHVPVHVVPHGVDHVRFGPEEPSPGADGVVLARHGIGAARGGIGAARGGIGAARYVLHTGTLQPRKDLPTLVAAFDRLAGTDRELLLVLAGDAGWGTADLDRAIAASPARERILRLGHVADADVPALVRRAGAVAYPSLEEGFGLPALEALACGAPLVTVEDSVMAELADGAALLVPRSDPRALADALGEQLGGGEVVAQRRIAGLERTAAFTWEACAEGHVRAYREAAGQQ